jgi:hypothetical protein
MFLISNGLNILLFKGFHDALHSLNRLTSINFHLPIDISVRRFVNNQDLIE